MKTDYKLKNWVVICIYIISIGAIVSSMFLIGQTLRTANRPYDNLSYVYRGLLNNDLPVVTYTNDKIIKPITVDATTEINFYDKDADPKIQEKSLIYYANTYMPNTGILYSHSEEFEVICVMDGIVEDIKPDEVMGNIITIKHSNNLRTIYQSLNEVKVTVGQELKQGELIGTSGMNKIKADKEQMLLFEVVYNSININPELFYEMDLKELS